jgi:hypothetical protein
MPATATNTEALILSGEGYNLEVAPDIIAQKATLIEHSALIVSVNDQSSSDAAGDQIKKLAAMRNMVEKSRTTVKAPVLAVGKRIDELAKEFQASITEEENRLKRLQGDYAAAVLAERNRILREQEAQRQAEEKARREAEAAEAARVEAARVEAARVEAARVEAARLEAARVEAARVAAEQAAWEATSSEEEEEAQRKADEAKRMADEAAAAEKERLRIAAEEQAKAYSIASTPTFIPEAVKGVKMVADFEVTDIDSLYRHNAGLVTLTERRKEILDAIARQTIGETLPTIPGLRVFLKPQVR